jgi:hypothetical protein
MWYRLTVTRPTGFHEPAQGVGSAGKSRGPPSASPSAARLPGHRRWRAVGVVDYDGGTLYALNPGTGAVRQRLHIGTAPHFASPALSGNRAYVGTMTGVVTVAGA